MPLFNLSTRTVYHVAAVLLCLSLSTSGCTNPATITAQPEPVPTYRGQLLAQDLDPGELREQMLTCELAGFTADPFSIAHRGAPLGYPEHTQEGYRAAADMGAGLIECDVTFTKDKALVCRHSQCDLHSTTNILNTPLAKTCRQAFTPASATTDASAQCCTSDITLAEFQSLCGRADFVNTRAKSIEAYLAIPDSPVTGPISQCGSVLSHADSIKLFDGLGVDFVPELKAPMVPMPFEGMTQSDYANKLIEEYKEAGIALSRVHPQSFQIQDVLYWIDTHPTLATNTVFLDGRLRDPAFRPSAENMQTLYDRGVRILAPPIPALVQLDDQGQLSETEYARLAKAANLQLITWTFEAGQATDPNNWIYASIPGFMNKPGRMLELLDFLAREVGLKGIFSDWPGTVSYYRSCRT